MAVIGSSFLAAGTDEDDDDTEGESFELETKRFRNRSSHYRARRKVMINQNPYIDMSELVVRVKIFLQ